MTNRRWAFKSLVINFLKAEMKIRPPVKSFFPKWDLSLESLVSASVWLYNFVFTLTLRTIFLMAIATARRVSKISAFSAREPYYLILQGKIILRLVPNFLEKVSTSFHINWESVLSAFPESGSEDKWKWDLVHSLSVYLDLTEDFWKQDNIFIFPLRYHLRLCLCGLSRQFTLPTNS